MEHMLKGAPVAAAMEEEDRAASEALAARGVAPVLAVLRAGERPEAASYVRGLLKKAALHGVTVRLEEAPETADTEELAERIRALNADASVHGILLLQPLPPQADSEKLRGLIAPQKDVDAATDLSMAGVFTGKDLGFAPATPEAVMAILAHYGVLPAGKRAAVVGRSLVVGRPLAMMLLAENATVTVCHSRTKDLPALTREADIVIAAIGRPKALGAEYFREGQIIVDVGIHRTEEGLCGDVDFAAAEPLAAAITPVPGGVGAVTTAVLLSHVVQAAQKTAEEP